jgi:hypothetical protein
MEILPVFIGYDGREDSAFQVCRRSLVKHSSIPLHIVRLNRSALEWPPGGGIFNRPWTVARGQRTDLKDLKPFSTEFSFTRFLVPVLQQYEGWALFCDSDFLFRADVAELIGWKDDRYAACVVKHNYNPPEQVKMDGCVQENYDRKNWSSLILWNCGHSSNRLLTRDVVNNREGSWLHGFRWLKDDEIGPLPHSWNYLVGHTKGIEPKAIHYTLGIPEMPGYEKCEFADLWWEERGQVE